MVKNIMHFHPQYKKPLLITLSFLFFTYTLFAEDKKNEDYVYESKQKVSLSKLEIISNTSAFLAQKFVSSKSAIQLNDPKLGKIIGDVVLMNPKAGFFHAFKGINGRFILDAKEGKFRLRMLNIIGTDGDGKKAAFGKLEGANRYRIEPMAISILDNFVAELKTYLSKVKESDDW